MMQDSFAPLIGFGTRVRKSPFFNSTRRWGCKAYTVYNRMYMPVYYENPVADYWRLVNDVTLWDVAAERQVEITGPDAARFTQMLTPRNLDKCAVGQCRYALLTDEAGGIVNDPVLLRLGENHFWLSAADSDVLLWARGIAHNAGMDVTIAEPDVSPLQVQGPKSTALMKDLFGDWIEDLKYFWFRETELDSIPLVVSRTGWSGERGYEIFLRDGAYGDTLWATIMAAGEPYDITPGAPSNIRRIEGALYSYGTDITLKDNPFEANLGRLVDLDMPHDFVGKAALKKIAAEGPTRRIVGLEIHGETLAANEEPWKVLRNKERIGRLTSCIYSPRLKKNIGLAMVGAEHADIGTKVTVQTPWHKAVATVVPTPFHEPKVAAQG